MNDEDLGRLLRGIFDWVKAGFVIGAFTLGILVMTHWDKTLLHGSRVVKDTATAQTESSGEKSAEDDAPPPRPVHHRRRHVSAPPPEPIVEDQAAPVAAAAPVLTPAPAAAPVLVVVAAPEEKHYIAHHKGRRGCDGDLILTDASLRFDCPSRPDQPLTFNRNAVQADDDGIRDLTSGHAYHFKISTMDKPQVCALFREWSRR